MSESIFKAGVGDFNVDQIVRDIQAEVTRKTESGEYTDARITRAERSNLVHLKNNREFLDYYLSCISRAVSVDIRKFEIPDRKGGVVGKAMVKLKEAIWGMLKFYTYRMWSQQNQVNGLLSTGISMIRQHGDDRSDVLERRVRHLEKALEQAGITVPQEMDRDGEED